MQLVKKPTRFPVHYGKGKKSKPSGSRDAFVFSSDIKDWMPGDRVAKRENQKKYDTLRRVRKKKGV